MFRQIILALFFFFFSQCDLQRKTGLQFLFPLETFNSEVVELSGLTFSSGVLTPSFSSNQKEYTVSVDYAVTSLTITPTVTPSTYPVWIAGNQVASGASSPPISLNLGLNTISIQLPRPGASTETYTIQITRLSAGNGLTSLSLNQGILNPGFSTATLNYTVNVANAVSAIIVTPTAQQVESTITVNGTTVTSGSNSPSITLNDGSNTITIIVTTQDQSSITYTINITKLATGIYRVFVTNTTTKGSIGVGGADTLCNSDSGYPRDGSTFKAMLTRTGVRTAVPNLDWVFKANTEYLRLDSLLPIFTTDGTGIFSFGNLTNSFSGGSVKIYRTGLRSNWETSTTNCSNWTSQTGSTNGRVGSSDQVDSKSIRNNDLDVKCSNDYYLLCVEQ
jgi:hypothetical protein